ncbi:Transposase IS200 like protein [Gemmata sp. SH-PL17]|uniref:transposase n=1 Tax=Gemmata sp. SH-PL17 TaxID=1630693 RepID=UPI0004B51F0F|nr:transposase [Gemmata sp. SH-PL17]AMV24662.1 Transposase IS200 like protein [Gemmata sp. SH-PL17]
MSQSVARNLIHLVFSTKYREPLITGDLYPAMFAYLIGAAKGIDCPAIIAGGIADHVHILFALHKTVALCKAVEELKKQSSKWAKENGGASNFYWQNGYGAFSVSPQNVPRVSAYIANQPQHHAEQPFQDEFRGLLHRAGEECDERTVWD